LAVNGLALMACFFADAGSVLPGAILGRVAWGAAVVLKLTNRMQANASKFELKGEKGGEKTFDKNCDEYLITKG
jgi:hypothetical protein